MLILTICYFPGNDGSNPVDSTSVPNDLDSMVAGDSGESVLAGGSFGACASPNDTPQILDLPVKIGTVMLLILAA